MRRLDLTGQKFGKLTVVGMAGSNVWNQSLCLVQCECGAMKTVRSVSLKKGDVRSCGAPECRACKYSVNGESLRRVCARIGLSYETMVSRITDKHMTPEEALERPVQHKRPPQPKETTHAENLCRTRSPAPSC